MKNSILRDPNTVEPQLRNQNPGPMAPHASPAITALVDMICGPAQPMPSAPAPATSSGPVLFIGLDVHNDSIAVSVAPSGSTEVRRCGIIGTQHDDVLKLLKKLHAAHPGAALKFCYEAGPRGYPLCRFLRSHGAECSALVERGQKQKARVPASAPRGGFNLGWKRHSALSPSQPSNAISAPQSFPILW